MSSFERIDTLREQNKSLLAQLSDLSGRLRGLNFGSSQTHEVLTPAVNASQQSRSAVTLNASQEPRSERTTSEDTSGTLISRHGHAALSDNGETESCSSVASMSVVALPGGDMGQARAALSRSIALTATEPLTSVNAEEAVEQETDLRRSSTPALHLRSPGLHTVGSLSYSVLLQDQGNQRLGQAKQADTEGLNPTSLSQEGEQRELGQMTSYDQDRCQDQDGEGCHLRPLLGYDWIAGLLDAEGSSLAECSEEFFTELHKFRQVNQAECVHIAGEGEDGLSPVKLSPSTEEIKSQLSEDAHQCTYCYRINNRLFPAPLDPQTACPVCKIPRSRKLNSDPAFIRVSIPRSTLLPGYCYKAHRRLSFNPSEQPGIALALHPTQLRTAHSRQQLVRLNAEVAIPAVTMGQSSEELIDVTRLASYSFPRLAPILVKPHNTGYPVY
ncbi:hypothetical protein GJAV_G00176230 [Gymnothorax javanicus]|nr:hypothetical protein GJAV_G00176230 [Gymnothorax javanicus]